MISEIRFRRGTSDEWLSKNPILKYGEPGLEYNTNGLSGLKIGDGFTAWEDLEYLVSPGGGSGDPTAVMQALQTHINSQTPHPVYDDGPSLALLYQNAKV